MKLRECSLTGVVRVAALASVSSPPVSSWRPCLCCPDQLAPSPLLANTGAGGGGQHGPCLLQEVGTTVPHTHLPLDTQFRISHDVCRQAARARRPRGRAAERSLLFVRFKVGGIVRCQLVAADWNQGIWGQARDLGIPTRLCP